jgi:hypothetical protein
MKLMSGRIVRPVFLQTKGVVVVRGLRLNAARAVALLGVAFATAASAQTVTVVEYYNKTLDAYFMTGRTPEQSALDGVADFQRTGMTFQATATAAATAAQTRICRFYIANTSPFTSSHFYGRQGVDCESIRGQNIPGFSWEDYDFATQQPTSGVCPGGTTPIYRGFRTAAGGKTSNHRYSASRATYDAAVATGYVGEGVAFCVTAATAATAAPTPSGDACGTFYFPGKQISYQTTSTGAASSTSTFVRTYDPTPVSFNGQTATRIVDTPSTGSPSYTMISDGATSWSELGGRSTGSSGTQETYFSPPIVFPKTMTVGQSISVNRTVTFNPATPTGNGTQTGTIVLTSRESVTAPAGTYANACKYTINTTTTYPIGSTSNTRTIAWVAPAVGMVRSEITDSSTVFGFTVTSNSTIVATAVQ